MNLESKRTRTNVQGLKRLQACHTGLRFEDLFENSNLLYNRDVIELQEVIYCRASSVCGSRSTLECVKINVRIIFVERSI